MTGFRLKTPCFKLTKELCPLGVLKDVAILQTGGINKVLLLLFVKMQIRGILSPF